MTRYRTVKLGHYWTVRLTRSFSAPGLVLGTLFFAASLTPSLIPRTYVMQGAVSGLSLAAGYGIGVFGHWLWAYLELPEPSVRAERILKLAAAGLCAAVALVFLWKAPGWQNSIRVLMEMPPADSAEPFRVGLIAIVVLVLAKAAGQCFQMTCHFFARRFHPHIPPRLSHVAAIVVAAALFWAVVDGVLLRLAMRAADASFQQVDALVDEGVAAPRDPLIAGSAASLIDWDGLGRAGRRFVTSGPTREQISAFLGAPAQQPIRVYAGLNSAETPAARAELALEELKRTGAFDRSILVVATPPGTGWIDPAAMNTLEFLHRGDVASVTVQYSYLPSWLSLLVEPDYGEETARALFDGVYQYWENLKPSERPRLYLHGLSLGALNSDLSTDLFDIIRDPIDGAVWSGPPFATRTWRLATRNRVPGTPYWLPRFRDGSIIRFTNQHDALDIPGAEWGPVRIVFLQYASDPVTFFDPSIFYREPEWLNLPRGPDVSPALRWYPIVTALQLLVDIAAATVPPAGYGHTYAPDDYIDAWVAVTEPSGWSNKEIDRLKDLHTPWPPEKKVEEAEEKGGGALLKDGP